jgi:hypothetical protein
MLLIPKKIGLIVNATAGRSQQPEDCRANESTELLCLKFFSLTQKKRLECFRKLKNLRLYHS